MSKFSYDGQDRYASLNEVVDKLDSPTLVCVQEVGGLHLTESGLSAEQWMMILGGALSVGIDEITQQAGKEEANDFLDRSLVILKQGG